MRRPGTGAPGACAARAGPEFTAQDSPRPLGEGIGVRACKARQGARPPIAGQHGCATQRRRARPVRLLLLEHDSERARQCVLVVDHPDADERTQVPKRTAYVVRALGLGHEAAPPRTPHWGAGLYDDSQVQSGELLVTTEVLSERRNHLDLEGVSRAFGVDALSELAGLGQQLSSLTLR